jgi:hypothetical protein
LKINLKKSSAIHPILFAIFPILLIITSNLDEVIFTDAWYSFLIIIGITLLSWLLLNFLFKNKLKSGLFVSLGLLLFFSYGHFLRMTNELGLDVSNLPFSHHTYAIPVYFLMLLLGTIVIIKTKKHLKDLTALMNILAIVLIVCLLPNIVSFSLESYDDKLTPEPLNYKISNVLELNEKPNIYYIILDEYTSDEILTKIYDYDNHDFLSQLTQRGFYIPSESYSNYPMSSLSIPSGLNMEYLNDKQIVPTFNDKNDFYNNNQIMRILKSLDYSIIAMSLEYGYPTIADYHLCPSAMFVNQFHDTLLDGSLWAPFSKFFITAGEPQRERVNCKFSELSNLESSYESPFFVFAHIMSPHPPYLFGPNGESTNPEFLSIGAASWDNKLGYVDQVQYINKKTIETIDDILLKNNSSIIIIAGDHGTPTQLGGGGLRWNNINDDSIKERMSIFNAYYFPNLNSEVIYDGITPVNSLRLVLNNYLNGNYELLEDTMYFNTYQDPLNFTDVTSLLPIP